MHLIIDAYGHNGNILRSEGFIYRLLDEYPARIGMTKIAEPRVIRYREGNPRDWGISGFVFIAESHISIHTFSQRNYVNVDVFSCKDFDADLAIKDIKERLELGEMRIHLLNRDGDSLGRINARGRPAYVGT